MSRVYPTLLACAAAVVATGIAYGATPEGRIPVPDIRALLVAAIDAPDGSAQGVLSGPLADALTERFQGTSPIHVDITTQRRYAQEGCRRLNVRFWQEGVRLPGAQAPGRQTVDFSLDYCQDGRPPRSKS
jgi:streptogramin lyase